MSFNNLDVAIALFAYKRPIHLERVIRALAQNYHASLVPLYVFIDGPRSHADENLVAQTCDVAERATGFKKIDIIRRQSNLGLFASLTSGITEILKTHSSVIVLEDDIVTSPYFIQYMCDALTLYQDNDSVASIHGYTPPISQKLPETFFLRGADCWGWATWRDRWTLFREDAKIMAQEIINKNLSYQFNLLDHYQYLTMLEDRAIGKNNSWAICWHASCFLAEMYTLYPGRSLVENIGFDGSGENCGPSSILQTTAQNSPVTVKLIPVRQSTRVFRRYCAHFNRSPSIVGKIRHKLLSFISRISPLTRSSKAVSRDS